MSFLEDVLSSYVHSYSYSSITVKVRTLCSFLLLDNLDDSERKYVDLMLEKAGEDDDERNCDWTKVISALVRRWRDKDDTIEIPRVEELIKSIGQLEGAFASSTLNPEQRSGHCLFLDQEREENHAELPFDVDRTFVKKVDEKRAKIRARKPKSSVMQEFKNRNSEERSRSQVSTAAKSTVRSKKTEKRAKKSRSSNVMNKRPRSKALPFMSQKVKSVKIFKEMSADEEVGEKKKKKDVGIATVGAMLKQKKKQKELEKRKQRKMKEKKRKREEKERKKEEAKRRKLEAKQSKGKKKPEENESKDKKVVTTSTKPASSTTKPAPPTKKPAPPLRKPAPPKSKPASSDLKMTNFSGQGDNVLTEADRKEILSFFRSKDSKNPFPNLGPMRKILLHKGYEFNAQGQKVKRIKIWMKLNYATREWFLAKTSKKSN